MKHTWVNYGQHIYILPRDIDVHTVVELLLFVSFWSRRWFSGVIICYLLTESEVITGLRCHIKAEVWDFPVMTEQTRLISNLLYGLFFMDLSLWAIKTNNWSADNFKKTHHLSELCTWAGNTVMWHWSADTFLTAVN